MNIADPQNVRALRALSAVRCGCDPREVAGMVPGDRCPSCQRVCDPWLHETAMARVLDARRDLRVALGMADRALLADEDGDRSRRNYALAAAALIANRATQALAFATASLHEEGRPAIGVAGARDQDQ